MADTVNFMGNKIPKPVAIGGVGAAGLIAVYFFRTKKQQQDAQASVNAAGSTEIDPATGYPYGSPEDAASLANQDNYQMPSAGGYGFSGYAGGSGSGIFGSGTPGSFNSNAEWAQYVEAYEVNNLGGDAPTVGNAIGKYLTGQPLTSDQVGLVQSAIAIAGYPPVSGPNGNPPGYVTGTQGNTNPPPNGNPGPTGPPGPPGPSGTIPAAAIDGLRLVKRTSTSFTVAWNQSYAPKGYHYRVEQLNAKIVKDATVGSSTRQVTVSGLHSGWAYNFGIQGLPGGPGKNLHVQL